MDPLKVFGSARPEGWLKIWRIPGFTVEPLWSVGYLCGFHWLSSRWRWDGRILRSTIPQWIGRIHHGTKHKTRLLDEEIGLPNDVIIDLWSLDILDCFLRVISSVHNDFSTQATSLYCNPWGTCTSHEVDWGQFPVLRGNVNMRIEKNVLPCPHVPNIENIPPDSRPFKPTSIAGCTTTPEIQINWWIFQPASGWNRESSVIPHQIRDSKAPLRGIRHVWHVWLLHLVVAIVAVQCVPPLKTTKKRRTARRATGNPWDNYKHC